MEGKTGDQKKGGIRILIADDHTVVREGLASLVKRKADMTVLAEATMSFLGLGVPPPTASWGAMLNDGRAHLFDAPHLVLFPAIAVMLAVLSFNFIGDALRDYLDPRSRIEAGL